MAIATHSPTIASEFEHRGKVEVIMIGAAMPDEGRPQIDRHRLISG